MSIANLGKGTLPVRAALSLLAGLLGGCAGPHSNLENVALSPVSQSETLRFPPPPPEDPRPYRLGPRDLLDIVDLDHSAGAGVPAGGPYRVQEDGTVLLPLTGRVAAAGKSLPELEADLNARFGAFVVRPNISVSVREFRSQRYFLLGQVGKPGAYPVDGPVTLLDAIGRAGGLTPLADLTNSYVLRGAQVLPLDFVALLRRGDLRYDLPLRNGDALTIGDLSDRKVFVLGEVRRPGVVALGEKPVTLLEALAQAGGLDPVTADRGNLLLVRGDYANPVITRMSLKDALGITAASIVLQPGDRILVASTGLADWNRFISQLLPTLQGANSLDNIIRDK